jgi:hypothetical protein
MGAKHRVRRDIHHQYRRMVTAQFIFLPHREAFTGFPFFVRRIDIVGPEVRSTIHIPKTQVLRLRLAKKTAKLRSG